MQMPWDDERITDQDLLEMLGFASAGGAEGARRGRASLTGQVRKAARLRDQMTRAAGSFGEDTPMGARATKAAAEQGPALAKLQRAQRLRMAGGGVAGALGGGALAYALAKLRHREEDRNE